MKNLDALYSDFKSSVASQDISSLDRFSHKGFWEDLDIDDKTSLAKLYLKRAQSEIVNESKTLKSLFHAEEMAGRSLEVMGLSAFVLFRLGQITQKKLYFGLAKSRLKEIQEANPVTFNKEGKWWLLWGNIYLALGQACDDFSYFEKAIEKYTHAISLKNPTDGLYWSLGEAWAALGETSGEIGDLQQAIKQYALAAKLGCNVPYFWIDYGKGLKLTANMLGDPAMVQLALSRFQRAVQLSSQSTIAYTKGVKERALGGALLYECTGQQEHFDGALALLKDAHLPKEQTKLYMQKALFTRSVEPIKCILDLEKGRGAHASCSSSGLALGLLGLAFDDLVLIREGELLIEKALKQENTNRELLFARGVCKYALGEYFDDEVPFSLAIASFQKALSVQPSDIMSLFYLSLAFFSWGASRGEIALFHEGFKAIDRVTDLRPYNPFFWHSWGEGAFMVSLLDSDHEENYLRMAIQKFSKAIHLGSELNSFYYLGLAFDHLGLITGDEQDHEKAIAILSKVFDIDPAIGEISYALAKSYMHYGELTHSKESFYRAINFFETLIEKDPEHLRALSDLGYTLLNLSELVEFPQELYLRAEVVLLRAARLGSTEVYYHIACLYALCDCEALAMQFLVKADRAKLLPNLGDLEYDAWLDPIKESAAFRQFIAGKNDTED